MQSKGGANPSRALACKIACLIALGAFLFIKISFLFKVPESTADIMRHLGYSSHAFDDLARPFYETIAVDFKPEGWTKYSADQEYIYPPFILVFFYIFSSAGLGITWVKLSFLAMDIGCAYIFYRNISLLSAVLYFCSFSSLWYVSHEGQYEVLQTLSLLITIILVRAGKPFLSGLALALSIQIKLFGLLLVPYLLYVAWTQSGPKICSFVRRILMGALGAAAGFIPFSTFYLANYHPHTPNILLFPIIKGAGNRVTYNPLHWAFWDGSNFGWLHAQNHMGIVQWNSLITYLQLAVIASAVVIGLLKRKFDWIALTPYAMFLSIVKSLRFGQFWYLAISPGFIFCSTKKNLVHALLLLNMIQCIHSFNALNGNIIGPTESPESSEYMSSCMTSCDAQTHNHPMQF